MRLSRLQSSSEALQKPDRPLCSLCCCCCYDLLLKCCRDPFIALEWALVVAAPYATLALTIFRRFLETWSPIVVWREALPIHSLSLLLSSVFFLPVSFPLFVVLCSAWEWAPWLLCSYLYYASGFKMSSIIAPFYSVSPLSLSLSLSLFSFLHSCFALPCLLSYVQLENELRDCCARIYIFVSGWNENIHHHSYLIKQMNMCIVL